ncbi:MAG: hypothetical protein R3190_17195 [Thermoanaerobaculia bacterium]|nr:hypothetical protein [Thermoanaerobaculia bacterium]
MTYRTPSPAPRSRVAEERRGRTVGRFCHACGTVYPLHRGRHTGKPLYGKDHVSSTCAHEGEAFDAGEAWWEPAVDVLPVPPAGDAGAEPQGSSG